MILIIMGSYLKHMDVVIFSSCAALPPGHSLSNKERGGGNGGKGKEKLPHANIYTVISFNCTLLFNLPWTNAFKSRTGGILLKSCLVPEQVFLIAAASRAWLFPTWQPALFPSLATSNMPHSIWTWRGEGEHTDWASFPSRFPLRSNAIN